MVLSEDVFVTQDPLTMKTPGPRGGPLAGIKVVEMAGIGPGPLAAMLLADLGATVIRVDRKESSGLGVARPVHFDIGLRNRKAIRVDLKDPAAVELVLDLVASADALIEGFRPGVMERLGLGPDVCMRRNPRLVFGRVTGWGQDGPLAQTAGHDINYIAITGLLHAIGREGGPPAIPLNVVGDYAGGSLYLAFGLLAGILNARATGQGQVVDAAMVDGVNTLLTPLLGLKAAGMMRPDRGSNLLDSGAPFYDVYACADGGYVSGGSIESKFFGLLLEKLGIPVNAFPQHMDRACWPQMRKALADRFRTRTREEWTALLQDTDVCFAPVLDFDEAPGHPHLRERATLVEIAGVVQPAPGPRFSRTPAPTPEPPAPLDTANARQALAAWLDEGRIAALEGSGTFI
jgi:alpha-methylacyl-CoA racemase